MSVPNSLIDMIAAEKRLEKENFEIYRKAKTIAELMGVKFTTGKGESIYVFQKQGLRIFWFEDRAVLLIKDKDDILFEFSNGSFQDKKPGSWTETLDFLYRDIMQRFEKEKKRERRALIKKFNEIVFGSEHYDY